jgi:hypothetical protein
MGRDDCLSATGRSVVRDEGREECKWQRERFALTCNARGTIEPIDSLGSSSRWIEFQPPRHRPFPAGR